MIPALARAQMYGRQKLLYENPVQLVTESVVTTVVQGTPVVTTTDTLHWAGLGSVQYVRPRIQKALPAENAGVFDDHVSAVVYVPYDAMPNEGMIIVDVGGALGVVGGRYRQSRKPADVAGVKVFWECYIGAPGNV